MQNRGLTCGESLVPEVTNALRQDVRHGFASSVAQPCEEVQRKEEHGPVGHEPGREEWGLIRGRLRREMALGRRVRGGGGGLDGK